MSEYRISDSLNYFLLSLVFILIIIFVIGIWIFAKWLTVGPKFHNKYKAIKSKLTKEEENKPLYIKKGIIIENSKYVSKLDEDIKLSSTPQELLDAQNKKESFEKEKKELEKKIIKESEIKMQKEKEKIEALKYKEEIKKESEKIKAEQKAKKENK